MFMCAIKRRKYMNYLNTHQIFFICFTTYSSKKTDIMLRIARTAFLQKRGARCRRSVFAVEKKTVYLP